MELVNDRSASATKLWPCDLSLPQRRTTAGTLPTTPSTEASIADPIAFVVFTTDPEMITRFSAVELMETGN